MDNMSSEVAKKESTEVSTALAAAMNLGEWGASPMTDKELVISHIVCLQPTSQIVANGDGVFGEFRCTSTNRKFGDFKNGFKATPFHMAKMWVEYDMTVPKDKKYIRTYAVTPENKNLPYKDDGLNRDNKKVPIERDYTLKFYVLLPEEVERGGELPYIITFRRTSLQNGKNLAMQMYSRNAGVGLPPPALTVTIESKKESAENTNWATINANLNPDSTRLSTPKEIMAALKWFKVINSSTAAPKEDLGDLTSDDLHVSAEAKASVETGPQKF
jgi:hypothetical protein